MPLLRLLAAAVMLLALPHLAEAHAHLKRAQPAANATATPAPSEVALTFTEAIEPKLSAIEVRAADGAKVDKGDTHAAGADAKKVVVGLAPLAPGAYTVTWKVVSVDGHKTQGSYTFTVAP